MSQENVEVVRSIYESLNRGDWDAATRPTDADFEVTFQRGPNAGTRRGRDSIRAIVEDQRAAFEAWIIEVEQVFDSDDQVVAVIKSRLRPKGTDAEFEIRNGHIWTLRDGVAVSLRGFPNPEEALEAAELRE
jgi:ketosteroid isomerase-like protein